MMEGAAACIARAGSFVKDPEKTFTVGLSLACVIAAVLWLSAPLPGPHGFLTPTGGTNFLFTRPAVTRGASVSRYFASMPRDIGIMAPQGLSPEVAYLTDKRVVALPFDPELLDRFIEEYHIYFDVRQFCSDTVRRSTATDRLVTAYLRTPEAVSTD
jgi:hypothetical protein